MTESERCKEMLENQTAPRTRIWRVTLSKVNDEYCVSRYCVWGWCGTLFWKDAGPALDCLFNFAEFHNLETFALDSNKNIICYTF